jgi:predicted porin
MKKTLVALAALASVSAFAQSSVSLTGLVDAGYQAVDYKGDKNAGIANNGRSTSTIQISGTEDLGNGLKANFKFNSDFDPTRGQSNTSGTTASATTWLNSEKFVGLSGGFGEVKVGQVNNLSLGSFGTGANFGTAVGSGFRNVTFTDVLGVVGSAAAAGDGIVATANASSVRFDKSVQYVTPSFAGFTAAVNYVKKNTGAASTDFSTTQHNYNVAGVSEAQVAYTNGPLNVSFTNQKQNTIGTGATVENKTTLNTLGANYTVGAFKLFALNQTAKAKEDGTDIHFNTSYTSFGVNYTTGATTLLAQTGSLKNKLAAAGDANKTKLLGLGADYALSKRTTAYLRYERLNDDGGNLILPSNLDAAGTDAGTITRTAIGIVHTF